MIEQVHGVDAMSSYKFITREFVEPFERDMFITGADLATMLHKLEQSSRLEKFTKGSQVGFLEFDELTEVTTLEDTSQLEPDWQAAWNAGLARLRSIPTSKRSNTGSWTLDAGVIWGRSRENPWVFNDSEGYAYGQVSWQTYGLRDWRLERDFSGEIVTERRGNRLRVSFTYLMQAVPRYNDLDLKEYYNFYFELRTSPTLNYPKGEVFS
tara:strand:- start:4 stop:633 length:630 start_codon:yes stop_codon:yes gene_type:complete